MYVFKGFAENELFENNAVGVVSAIGELSVPARTYSREIGTYISDAIAPDLQLLSFKSAKDGVLQPLDNDLRDHILTVVKWMYNKTVSTAGQLYADDILTLLLTQFQTVANSFQSGAMITDGTNWIPEWLSWKHNTYNGGDNYIRIWFGDDSFKRQYDEFDIVVVPPITNLDDFFKLGKDVDANVNSRTMSQAMDVIQQAKNGYPETIIRTEAFNYIDPLNATHIVNTNWTVLIYGAMGNNIDSISDALVAYILANSTHTRDDWVQLLPDIFKRTEFVLLPLWDQYAIPNRTIEAGIYSPVANLTRVDALIKTYAPGYPSAHIDAHTTVLGHPYKSLAIASIGSIDNRNSQYELTDVFPDFVAVSSTSQDFNRMSSDTRGFAAMLSDMLLIAEGMTQFSDIPFGSTRVNRNGILYLVRSYENIHYLVVAKQNFPAQ